MIMIIDSHEPSFISLLTICSLLLLPTGSKQTRLQLSKYDFHEILLVNSL